MSEPWHDTLGVFDLETTGIDVETSRIVSAFVGVIGPDGNTLERTAWLANPGIAIPEGASAVHGITTERAVAMGSPARIVVAEIIDALQALFDRGLPVVIYNAPYDLSLLAHEARRYGLEPLGMPKPIIDPLVIDRSVDRYRKGKRTLSAAAEVYGVTLDEAHDAGADAVAAGHVAQALARRYPEQFDFDAHALHDLQVGWCLDQARNFQEYMRRTVNPLFSADGTWPQRLVAALY